MDYQFTKTKLIPKLMLTLKDQNIDIRKDSLKALYAIVPIIDFQTLTSNILPAI
jgi:hypothetical protein